MRKYNEDEDSGGADVLAIIIAIILSLILVFIVAPMIARSHPKVNVDTSACYSLEVYDANINE